jgi:hypothetical protein
MNYRDELVRMAEEGLLDAVTLAIMVAKWLTPAECEEMMDANELTARFTDEEEE